MRSKKISHFGLEGESFSVKRKEEEKKKKEEGKEEEKKSRFGTCFELVWNACFEILLGTLVWNF